MKKLFLKVLNRLKRLYISLFPLNKFIFSLHEFFVVLIYGKTSDYFEFRISNELLSKLKLYLNNLDFLNFIDSPSDRNNFLIFNAISNEIKSKLDDNLRIMDLNSQDSLFLELQKELYDNVKYYVKSKICFCNIRAWKTLPKSELFGPNQLHVDGFLKGHLKIMLYLSPLSTECGELLVGTTLITNRPEGTAVIFRNSDVIHAGVPGNSKDRVSIEITIFRSFINQYIFHRGHYNGRHYKSVLTPYLQYFSTLKNKA